MLNSDQGCCECPYSRQCSPGMKMNYGLTLVGPDSYKFCKAFDKIKSSEDPSCAIADIERNLPKLAINMEL